MRLALHKLSTRSGSKLHVRDVTTRDVASAWVRQGTLKQFFQGIGTSGITVSPATVSGAASSSSPTTVTSGLAKVSVSGGVAPYDYSWSQVSGDTMSATAGAASASAFTTTVSPGSSASGMWQCLVTDAAGTTGTVTVNVRLLNIGSTL